MRPPIIPTRQPALKVHNQILYVGGRLDHLHDVPGGDDEVIIYREYALPEAERVIVIDRPTCVEVWARVSTATEKDGVDDVRQAILDLCGLSEMQPVELEPR